MFKWFKKKLDAWHSNKLIKREFKQYKATYKYTLKFMRNGKSKRDWDLVWVFANGNYNNNGQQNIQSIRLKKLIGPFSPAKRKEIEKTWSKIPMRRKHIKMLDTKQENVIKLNLDFDTELFKKYSEEFTNGDK